MKLSTNDIVMNHMIDNVVDHLKYQDESDRTIGEIDRYLRSHYDDTLNETFHKNNGYIKVSNELQRRA